MKKLLFLCLIISTATFAQRNRTGWIEPTDQNFTARVLNSKQNAYNRNLEAVMIMERQVNEKLRNVARYLKTVTDNPSERNMQQIQFYVKVVDNMEKRPSVDFSSDQNARSWINYYYEVLTAIENWNL